MYTPKISPKKAPALQNMIECHSSLIFMKRMANDAVTMPVEGHACVIGTCTHAIKSYLMKSYLIALLKLSFYLFYLWMNVLSFELSYVCR
jgi:hypothetical protein